MLIRSAYRQGSSGLFLPSYYSAASGATIPELFTALPSGTPGLCYRFADSRFNSSARNGSTGFGATSGSLGMVLDQARGALDALGADALGGAGSFSSTGGWTIGAGWAIASGVATFNNSVASNLDRAVTLDTGKTYLVSIACNSISGGTFSVQLSGSGQTVLTAAASGPFSAIVVPTLAANTVRVRMQPNVIAEIDNLTVREIPGLASWALSDAARPTLGGFAGGATLSAQFNGTNSALQSVGPFDLSGTDEVMVIAVVRKLSDAITAALFELGTNAASVPGTFHLLAPNSPGLPNYTFRSIGTIAQSTGAAVGAAPDNAILVASAKIGSDIVRINRNGGADVTNTGDQGTGNYGAAYSLNIGARNAASLFFNGHIAALCIVGLQPSNLPAGWLETMTGLLVPPDATFS